MAIKQKLCPICGKVDCKRYGNVIIGGRINTKLENMRTLR
jgi:hypothetical protein